MIQATTPFERARAWLPLIPLLLLLAGTYWLNQQVQPISAKPDTSKRHDIDFAVENLSTTTLDEHGQARYKMTTEKMWHYPDDDSTHLQRPRFISLHSEQPPLITTALSGKVSSHGDEVFLYDEVKVTRLDKQAGDEMVFNTDYLHIVPDQNLADTDRPVTLVTAHDTIRAVGMTMNSQSRVITFLSQVHATHVSTPK